MKDIHNILRDKEADCVRVQQEIDALRLVISLLEEDKVPEAEARKQPEPAMESAAAASSTGTEGPTFSTETSFWKRRR